MITYLFIYDDAALLVLRLVLGSILIVHGLPKIKDLRKNSDNFEGMGFRPGMFWGTIVAFVEVFGGAFIMAGLLTQIAAFLAAVQLAVATWLIKFKWQKPFVGGYELEILIFASAVVLAALGAGSYSLDEYFLIFLY